MPALRRAPRLALAVCGLFLAASLAPGLVGAAAGSLTKDQRATLLEYATTTWASFVAMTDEDSGLPADSLRFDGTRSVQTSTTNIGAYLWSTVVAEELGIITHSEAVERVSQTLETLAGMERHEESGQFYNWYDHRTGEKLTIWPSSGDALPPILSSVDNGWLAAGLKVVAGTVPEVADDATAIYDSMDFGFYYREGANRILFHYAPDTGEAPCCYDTIVSESRIATYIGIAKGEIPAKAYFGQWRTFPDIACDWAWQETKPLGVTQTYLGVDVFEGAYPYEDFLVVPGWGGSMFEALMPALFVPEEKWGPESWKINHPLTVAAQIHHGLVEAEYGYWGFSPANIPEGGYREYGVDALGMFDVGYTSNADRTTVNRGYEGCRPPEPDPPPSAYTNGVVTPHAAFLALRWAPDMTLENLANLRDDFADLYGPWGFRDSVNVDSGRVSDFYLSLDQGIIMAAIGNALAGDVLRDAFASKDVRKALQPVMSIEEFGAGPLSAANRLR
jgi:hypothetical protein